MSAADDVTDVGQRDFRTYKNPADATEVLPGDYVATRSGKEGVVEDTTDDGSVRFTNAKTHKQVEHATHNLAIDPDRSEARADMDPKRKEAAREAFHQLTDGVTQESGAAAPSGPVAKSGVRAHIGRGKEDANRRTAHATADVDEAN